MVNRGPARAALGNETRPAPGLVVVSHGLVAAGKVAAWRRAVVRARARLAEKPALVRFHVYCDLYQAAHFVAFAEWADREVYGRERLVGEVTVEEFALVGGPASRPAAAGRVSGPAGEPSSRPGRWWSRLAAYNQYYCRPLALG